MGHLRIEIEAPGADTFDALFDHLEHIPDDFRPLWEKMSEDFWEHENQVFEEEGPGWRPLAWSTRWDRHYHGFPPSHPILVRTGALKASLTEGFAPGSVFNVYPLSMEVGTDLKTADGYTLGALHQFGSLKVRDRPPKRPPVTITEELQNQWRRRVANWLREELDYQG